MAWVDPASIQATADGSTNTKIQVRCYCISIYRKEKNHETLTTMFATLVLLVTVGMRSVSTDFALNEANDEPAIAQTVAGVEGDDAPGSDYYNSWAG